MEPKVDVDALLSLCEALRTDLTSSDIACKNWAKRYEQIREEYRSLVLVVVDMETLLEDLEIIATVDGKKTQLSREFERLRWCLARFKGGERYGTEAKEGQ